MSWHRTGELPLGAENPFPAAAGNHTNNPIHKSAEFPLRTMKFACCTVLTRRLQPKLSVPQILKKSKINYVFDQCIFLKKKLKSTLPSITSFPIIYPSVFLFLRNTLLKGVSYQLSIFTQIHSINY